MSASGFEKPSPSRVELTVIVAVLVVVSVFLILIVRRQHVPSNTMGETDAVPPAQEIRQERGSGPVPESGEETRPLYPPSDWSNLPPSGARENGLSGQTVTRELPDNPALKTKTEPLPLSAPVAQVHSLAEANSVMGPPTKEATQIGVTTIHKLPDQTGLSQTRSLSESTLETPRGIPSSEAGRSKTFPLPKEPGQP